MEGLGIISHCVAPLFEFRRPAIEAEGDSDGIMLSYTSTRSRRFRPVKCPVQEPHGRKAAPKREDIDKQQHKNWVGL